MAKVDNSIADFTQQLVGQVLVKGSVEYEEARCRNFAVNAHAQRWSNNDNNLAATVDNKNKNTPAYIAICQSVADVQACIRFALAQGLTVTVRTGGHNWFGCFLRDNVFLIDMSRFDALAIDNKAGTATVGPAVLGNDLNEAAAHHQLCFSTGHCLGVPLGGFLLGGGIGWFQPYFGYAAEHIEEVTLVDAQGNVVVATDKDDGNVDEYHKTTTTSGGDWMWMVRGAASAFPGVVVEFKIRLAPLPAIVRVKADFFPVESYSKIVHFLNDYYHTHCSSETTDDDDDDDAKTKKKNTKQKNNLELTVNLACTPPPLADALQGVPKVAMVIQTWKADSEEEFREQVAPLAMDRFPVAPLLPESPFQDMSFVGLSQMTSGAYPPGQHWCARALFHDSSQSFDKVDWEGVQTSFVQKAPLGLSHCMLIWGPAARVASKPGCYGKYSSRGFTTLTMGVHGPPSEEQQQQQFRLPAQEYVDAMMGHLEPYVCKYDPLEHPLNEETFEMTFPDGVAEQLRSLRAKVDPQKLFFDPSTAKPSH